MPGWVRWLAHKYEAAKGWFEHWHFIHFLWVGLAAALSGLWAWLKNYDALAIFIICLVVLVLIIFVVDTIMRWMRQHEEDKKKEADAKSQSSLDRTISLEVAIAKFPVTVPASGVIEYLAIHAQENQDGSYSHSIGLGLRIGTPGESWDWNGNDHGYKCTVTNYGPKVVTNFRTHFTIGLREWLKTATGASQGELKNTYEHSIAVTALKQDAAEAFEFYFMNLSLLSADVVIPTECSLQVMGEAERRTVKLMSQTKWTGFFLPPRELPPSPVPGGVGRDW